MSLRSTLSRTMVLALTLAWALAIVLPTGAAAGTAPAAPPADQVPQASQAEQTSKELPVTSSQAQPESPEVRILENGLTVLTLKDTRFPLVSLRLYVHAGSAYEDPAQAGISHLLEHMVFKGTERRGEGEVAREIEGVGGYLNAATSFDYTVYYVDVPKDAWQMGMDVVQDMIFGARIDPEALESEKKVVLSELERGEDSPKSLLFKTMQELVWPDTSYGWPIIGTRESVSGVSRDDILQYIHRQYQPQRMLLVAVGDIDPKAVRAEAAKLFGPLSNDRTITPPKEIALGPGDGPHVRVLTGAWNKAYLSLAFPVPNLKSEEVPGLELLSQLLGGDKTSLLWRTYKYEKRMVDEIWAAALTLERGGMFLIQAVLDADKVEPFLADLTRELAGLNGQRFDAVQVDRAVLNLEDSLFRAKETLSGLASKIGYFQFFEGGLQAEENYLYSLRVVDQAQLDGLIHAYLRPERLSAVALLPEASPAQEAPAPGAPAPGEPVPPALPDTGPDTGPGTASTPDGTAVTPAAAQASAPAAPVLPDADALAALISENWAKAAQAVEAPEQTGKPGQIETVELPGGSQVVLLPDPTLPYAAVSITWPGGDCLTGDQQQGLPELTARVLNRGTAQRSNLAMQDYLSDRASAISASAGRDTFSVSARYPVRFAGEILPVLEEVMTQPAFAPDELDRARQEQGADIRRREDEPLGLAFRHTFPFLYSDTGYGAYHLGTLEGLAGFDVPELRSFWDQQRRQSFVLSVCGQFDRQRILDLAERLAQVPEQADAEAHQFAFPDPDRGAERTLALNMPGRNQAHVLRIFPVPGLDGEDAAGLSLLRSILAGQSGILFRDLRDRQGLGYTVTAILWQAPKTGFLAFYIGTTPEQIEAAEAGFAQAIAELTSTPLDQAELDRASNLLEGDYYREHQSLASRASEASSLAARELPQNYYEQIITQAKALTPEQVRQVAEKYLVLDNSYLVTVTP